MTSRSLARFAVLSVAAVLAAASTASADERLCTSLGAGCVCNEPLATGTVNGGQTFAQACAGNTTTCYVDPDDSGPKECPYGGGKPLWGNAGGSFEFISAGSQPLPSGNQLSHVLKRVGSNGAGLVFPNQNALRDSTTCIRSYMRWDPSSPIPGAGTATANSQYKIGTIGGVDPQGNHNPNQLGVIQGGAVYTRADGNWLQCAPQFSQVGNMTECVGNYCRFEICIDLKATGRATPRFRTTLLAPHPNAGRTYTSVLPECAATRDSLTYTSGDTGFSWFGQNLDGQSIRYATHAIITEQRPANGNWWPGAACEVEGGCNGTPPPPPPPSTTPPIAPSLEP